VTAQPLTVDPRFRARRVAVLRAAGRRRLWWIVAVSAVLLVVGGAWFASRTSLLDVDQVRVDGATVTPAADITAALALGDGTPMIDVDPGVLAERVEALPLVAEATVTRHWPNRIVVEVTERSPVALAMTAPDAWVEVDVDGRVLGPAPEASPLPRLSGVRAAGELATFLDDDAAAPIRLVELAQGTLDVAGAYWSDGELWLRLHEGPSIRVGTADDLGIKVVAAATLLRHLQSPPEPDAERQLPAVAGPSGGGVLEIDVSVPTAPVARTARSMAGLVDDGPPAAEVEPEPIDVVSAEP